jgi:DNA polymerase I-like protein with 3'-5' exonuclease and polymerase domains
MITDLQTVFDLDLGIAEVKIAAIFANSDIKDKHTATAAVMYNVPEDEVTSEQRFVAKQANYLTLYGDINDF